MASAHKQLSRQLQGCSYEAFSNNSFVAVHRQCGEGHTGAAQIAAVVPAPILHDLLNA